jgi:hypothetical protein
MQTEHSMSHRILTAVAGSLVVVCSVHAQDPASYTGKWTGELSGAGRPVGVTLVVDGQKGSWDTMARSRSDTCIGLKAPIVVTKATADVLEFDIKASEALAGCRDTQATLQRVDGGVLKGTRGNQELVLKRD